MNSLDSQTNWIRVCCIFRHPNTRSEATNCRTWSGAMNLQSVIWAAFLFILIGGGRLQGGDDGKTHEVGSGLEIKGELGKDTAITYQVNLAAGKTYVIT